MVDSWEDEEFFQNNPKPVADYLQYNRDPYWESFAIARGLKLSRKVPGVYRAAKDKWEELRVEATRGHGIWVSPGCVIPVGPEVPPTPPTKQSTGSRKPVEKKAPEKVGALLPPSGDF